jgi:hypothetical protein
MRRGVRVYIEPKRSLGYVISRILWLCFYGVGVTSAAMVVAAWGATEIEIALRGIVS